MLMYAYYVYKLKNRACPFNKRSIVITLTKKLKEIETQCILDFGFKNLYSSSKIFLSTFETRPLNYILIKLVYKWN